MLFHRSGEYQITACTDSDIHLIYKVENSAQFPTRLFLKSTSTVDYQKYYQTGSRDIINTVSHGGTRLAREGFRKFAPGEGGTVLLNLVFNYGYVIGIRPCQSSQVPSPNMPSIIQNGTLYPYLGATDLHH